jgi:hypothetical protein
LHDAHRFNRILAERCALRADNKPHLETRSTVAR